MNSRKSEYVTPNVYKVELDSSQAILSACSLLTSGMSTGGMQFCRFNCKSHGIMSMSDSVARPS